MQLTRPKVVATTLLAVLAFLWCASTVVFAQDGGEDVILRLTPNSGCPGQRVDVTVLIRDIATDAHVAYADHETKLTSYPEGLITSYNGEYFIVGDSVCAGDYVVTVEMPFLIDGVGNGQAKTISASTHFTVGGNGCPNLAPCRPVGGVVMPTRALAVAAPYLALAGLAAVVSTVFLVKRRRD